MNRCELLDQSASQSINRWDLPSYSRCTWIPTVLELSRTTSRLLTYTPPLKQCHGSSRTLNTWEKIRGESSREFMQEPRLLGIGQRVPTIDGHLWDHRGVSTRKVRTALLRGIFIDSGRKGKGDAAEGEDKGLLGGVVFGRTSGAEGLVNLIARWTGLGGTKYHSTTKNRIMYIFRQ